MSHLIITSELHLSQPLCFMIAGRAVAHSDLYSTRETQRSNAEWNCIWCAELSTARVGDASC